MHYGSLFPILHVCVFLCVHAYVCLFTYGHVYVCMFIYVRTRVCMHLIICMYVCMRCRRRYMHYGILFPILQVCVFVMCMSGCMCVCV